MLRALYIMFGLAVIAAYGYASFMGMEIRRPRRGTVPTGVRGSSGGYTVWHSGYHGGK